MESWDHNYGGQLSIVWPAASPLAPVRHSRCHLVMDPPRDFRDWHVVGEWYSMLNLAGTLSSNVGRVILDRTGLTGNFDVELQWMPDLLPLGGDSSTNPAPPPPDGPSLFTALQEQLGLKLESTKGPVDVLVIDHVEKPTED